MGKDATCTTQVIVLRYDPIEPVEGKGWKCAISHTTYSKPEDMGWAEAKERGSYWESLGVATIGTESPETFVGFAQQGVEYLVEQTDSDVGWVVHPGGR